MSEFEGLILAEIEGLKRRVNELLETNDPSPSIPQFDPLLLDRPRLAREPTARLGNRELYLSIRRELKDREIRAHYFPPDFCEGAPWNILCGLFMSQLESRSISVSGACELSFHPPTTSLRYIESMMEAELIRRCPDQTDKRRHWIVMSDQALRSMVRYVEHKQSNFADEATREFLQ